jgi:hypothetical protein
MKTSRILGLALILVSLSLTSCNLIAEKTEYDHGLEATNLLKGLIAALDKDDLAATRSCFSAAEGQQQTGFEEKLSQLLSYYDGAQEEWIRETVYSTVKEDGKKATFYDSSVDLLTDKDVYRFAARWCVQSDKGTASVGIRSFAILKYYDDPNCKARYWGDGLWEPGIQIALANSKK